MSNSVEKISEKGPRRLDNFRPLGYTKDAKAPTGYFMKHREKTPGERLGDTLSRGIFPLGQGSPPPNVAVEPLADAVTHHTGHNGQEEPKQVTHMKHPLPPPGMKDGRCSIP